MEKFDATKMHFDEAVKRWPMLGRLQAEMSQRFPGRMDDISQIAFYFTRQLTFIYTKTYDIKYAELMARKCFAIDREVPPGAEYYVYRQYDQVGMAMIVNSYSKDFPRVDVRATEVVGRVKEIGDSFGYNWKEIQSSLFSGIPLEQRRANMAKRGVLQRENEVVWFGDVANNLIGVFNNTNITVVTPPADGTGASMKFSAKTAAQILRDMSQPFITIRTVSRNVEQANTLLMATSPYGYISMTPYSQYSDKTILQWFLANQPQCKEVVSVDELSAVAQAPYSGDDCMIAYVRDEDHFAIVVPQEFFMAPPQMEGFEWTINCMASTGGLKAPYPLAMIIVHGI